MTLSVLEQEEQDRIQYEIQLAGQGGKRWGMFSGSKDREKNVMPKSVTVRSSENYILTLENVKLTK